MKATELIDKLQKMVDAHGDFDMLVRDDNQTFVTDIQLIATPNDKEDDSIALVSADENWFK